MITVIVGAIVEVGKWLADKAITIGLVIFHATRIVGLALFRFGHAVAGVFGKVWTAFSKFYASVLKPFIDWAWRSILKFHAWLTGTFGPLLKFLDALRRDVLDVYTKWLRPIFDTIDTTRQVLRLLADFHVPFAAKLDDALARVEARLMAPIRLALTKINELIYWIDRIVDFNGLFQRLTLIESQWRYVGDTWAVLLKHQPAGVSRAQNDELHRRDYPAVEARALGAQLGEYYAAGAGELAPSINEIAALVVASTAR